MRGYRIWTGIGGSQFCHRDLRYFLCFSFRGNSRNRIGCGSVFNYMTDFLISAGIFILILIGVVALIVIWIAGVALVAWMFLFIGNHIFNLLPQP